MTQPRQPIGPNARSPFAGCLILIIALAVMIFLLAFSAWSLFRQYDAIARFTGDRPAPVELDTPPPGDPRLAALETKLTAFRSQLDGDAAATLALTPAEINLAIGAFPAFSELRDTFHVDSVVGDTLRIAISFKLNGRPRLSRAGEKGFTTSDPRYLNGTMVARPRLLGREVILEIVTIEVPGATVPPEFIAQMSPYRITERYVNDPAIGPVMAKLTSADAGNGALHLNRIPGQIPPDRMSDSELDSGVGRFFRTFAIGACVFLMIVGIIVYIGIRAKSRSAGS